MEDKRYRREGKRYDLKSSASRAAKQDGVVEGQFEVFGDKKAGFYYKITDVHKSVSEQYKERNSNTRPAKEPKFKKDKKKKDEPTEEELDRELAELTEEEKKAQEENLRMSAEEQEHKKEDTPVEPVKEEPKSEIIVGPSGLKVMVYPEKVEVPAEVVSQTVDRGTAKVVVKATQVKRISSGPDDKLHKSQVTLPTKLVWTIADEMFAKNPSTTRKQVIEECTKRGIAFFTARTQYQQWLSATRKKA